MIAGRKLLLADDSAAVQKVIELTFADEGMEVFTVGNGRLALETMERVLPDVILADAFMPEMGGYELCRCIKQNARFAQTPVMLLVSAFEPFDENEAKRAGADDIVTKPFESIRQLVSRVGSLLGGERADKSETAHNYSTLGLSHTEADAIGDQTPIDESNITVLVEAPIMEYPEAEMDCAVVSCVDMELQTADTQKLEPFTDEAAEAPADDERQFQDTIEVESIGYAPAGAISVDNQAWATKSVDENMNESFAQTPSRQTVAVIDDALLDLEEEVVAQDAIADDDVLDLDFEETTYARRYEPVVEAPAAQAPEAPAVAQEAHPKEHEETSAYDWAIVPEPKADAPSNIVAEVESVSSTDQNQTQPLSSAAIEAIAREVVEQISEKVVREIAWEVIPELSELLIKKKLDETK